MTFCLLCSINCCCGSVTKSCPTAPRLSTRQNQFTDHLGAKVKGFYRGLPALPWLLQLSSGSG